MNETKPKKMVRRNVAAAIGIICITFVAALIGFTAYFRYEISKLNSQVSQLNTYNSNLNATIDDLKQQGADLNDTVNLDKSEDSYNTSTIVTYPPFQGLDLPATFVDNFHTPVGSYILFSSSDFTYPGYLIVQINSTSNDTYINYTCNAYVGAFNLQTDVGTHGTTILPVLPLANHYLGYPSGTIIMTVSTHTSVQARMNITVTYYY